MSLPFYLSHPTRSDEVLRVSYKMRMLQTFRDATVLLPLMIPESSGWFVMR